MEMHVLHNYDPNPWAEELGTRELFVVRPEAEWKWLCAVAPDGAASVALRLDVANHVEFNTVLAECSLASLIVLLAKIREVDPSLFIGTPLAVPPSGER
jgi:hypothetical protein